MENVFNITNYHIEELKVIEGLSERTKNVCSYASIDTLYKILCYYLEHKTFRNIRNCGLSTEKELVELAKKYSNNLNLTKEQFTITSKSMKEFEEFRLFCLKNFQMPSNIALSYQSAFMKKRFPIFKFIEDLTDCMFDEREKFIFRNSFYFYQNSKKEKLQKIGDRFSFTRERARQISENVFSKFENALLLFAEIFPRIEKWTTYKSFVKKDFLDINISLENKVNKAENLSFTNKFYWFVLKTYFRETKVGFQAFDKKLSNYYLINTNLGEAFDFEGFYSSVEERMNDRIPENFVVDVDCFLNPFVKGGHLLNENLKTICKQILSSHFGLKIQQNEIVFPRNTLVRISEIIVNILEKAGHPLSLNEIYNKLKRSYPSKLPPNLESLRSSIFTNEEIIAIGKTSTYALKWWDTQTGTIKEIIKRYLQQFDTPKRISDICAHVNLYRKTSEKNILSNLKLDKTNTFVFHKGGYVGLQIPLPEESEPLIVEKAENKKEKVVLEKKEEPEGVLEDPIPKKEEKETIKKQLTLF